MRSSSLARGSVDRGAHARRCRPSSNCVVLRSARPHHAMPAHGCCGEDAPIFRGGLVGAIADAQHVGQQTRARRRGPARARPLRATRRPLRRGARSASAARRGCTRRSRDPAASRSSGAARRSPRRTRRLRRGSCRACSGRAHRADVARPRAASPPSLRRDARAGFRCRRRGAALPDAADSAPRRRRSARAASSSRPASSACAAATTCGTAAARDRKGAEPGGTAGASSGKRESAKSERVYAGGSCANVRAARRPLRSAPSFRTVASRRFPQAGDAMSLPLSNC